MNFDELNLHPEILAGVRDTGYKELTPIQEQSIPPILAGKDIIGLAQTGTGKTASFVLPILQQLMSAPRKQVNALIITPTRELAEQVNDTINKLGRRTGLKSIAVYGGTNMSAQIKELASSVEIIVACPGRLLDHLWRGSIELSHLQILVLDEADRMLDMGFLPDIQKIIKCLMHPRQTLLFSATMPDAIKKLTREILTKPITVQIGQTAPAETVSHALYPVKQHLKTSLLMEILHGLDSKSVLIFTRTKHRTERIATTLKAAGFKAAALQGDMVQSRRQAALDSFRKGTNKILVATDIMARGIDVMSISHVINFDMPANTDDYIHRIGRTGRVQNTGEAFTLVTETDSQMVTLLERILKKKIERRTLPDFDYKKPAPEGTGERQYSSRPPANRSRSTPSPAPYRRRQPSAPARVGG